MIKLSGPRKGNADTKDNQKAKQVEILVSMEQTGVYLR